MKSLLHLIAIWLVCLTTSYAQVSIGGQHTPYDLIALYNAYLIDFYASAASNTPRSIAPNVNHNPNSVWATEFPEEEQAFLAQGRALGLTGAAGFDEFVDGVAVSHTLEGTIVGLPSFDPPKMGQLQDFLPNKGSTVEIDYRQVFPGNALFQIQPSGEIRGTPADAWRLVDGVVANAQNEMSGTHEPYPEFWQAHLDTYIRGMSWSLQYRAYAHSFIIREELWQLSKVGLWSFADIMTNPNLMEARLIDRWDNSVPVQPYEVFNPANSAPNMGGAGGQTANDYRDRIRFFVDSIRTDGPVTGGTIMKQLRWGNMVTISALSRIYNASGQRQASCRWP